MIVALNLTALAAICSTAPLLQVTPSEEDAGIQVIAHLPKKVLETYPVGNVDQDVGVTTLKLCLVNEDGKPGPAIFGQYRRSNGSLIFAPRYQLVPGQLYRAYFSLANAKITTVDYRAPSKLNPERPEVEKVYPSGDTLPANHLKFYIYFSKPMREGRAIFHQVHLLDSKGKSMPDTWRRRELWSADARRLTLWIHPGRVKRGVNLREEFGPVLEASKEYSLLITAEVQDADGVVLGENFTKTFRTRDADYGRPLPQDWKLIAPRAGTKQPLCLDFGEPLDHALAKRLLKVVDADGKKVSGHTTVTENETTWQFQPSQPWRTAEYRIEVDELLEDLAGNTPVRVFDRDLKKARGAPPKLSLPFRSTNG